MNIPNNYLVDSKGVDFIFHLGVDSSMNLREMFGGVVYVIMSGGKIRTKDFAERLAETFNHPCQSVGKSDRYTLYKVGHIMCVSHGMGSPSISILLVELTKLFFHAGATGVTYIRTGTCGGLGIPPGTLVISDRIYNERLEEFLEVTICGKPKRLVPVVDKELVAEMYESRGVLDAIIGGTMSCNTFYSAQGRLDGILGGVSPQSRKNFLDLCHSKGIRNIEMEGLT